MSNAFNIVFAPFWICVALAMYSLTREGIVWKLMVGTILICAFSLAGITIYDYLEASNLWFITPTFGGPVLLFMLLALWYFRIQGDSFITSNDWRAAMFYLTVLGLVVSVVIIYKFYLTSREADCREMCLAQDQEYAYTSPRIGYGNTWGGSRRSKTEECRCFAASDYPAYNDENY